MDFAWRSLGLRFAPENPDLCCEIVGRQSGSPPGWPARVRFAASQILPWNRRGETLTAFFVLHTQLSLKRGYDNLRCRLDVDRGGVDG